MSEELSHLERVACQRGEYRVAWEFRKRWIGWRGRVHLRMGGDGRPESFWLVSPWAWSFTKSGLEWRLERATRQHVQDEDATAFRPGRLGDRA